MGLTFKEWIENMKFKDLSDRMKFYEREMCPRLLPPLLPVIVRLDGKAFHTYTKQCEKPFDSALIQVMQETTKSLVEYTNAKMGYTQCDEISLLLYSSTIDSQIFFDGKRDKINSILAAVCSHNFRTYMIRYTDPAIFDCRCFFVPNCIEAINHFVWREQDATRNSQQMVGQAHFSQKELHGLSCNQIQEKLFQEKGVNWNDYPSECKRGTYYQKTTQLTPFSSEEIEKLPPKHEARTNPDLLVERSVVRLLSMPPINQVTNKEEVFFRGVDPTNV